MREYNRWGDGVPSCLSQESGDVFRSEPTNAGPRPCVSCRCSLVNDMRTPFADRWDPVRPGARTDVIRLLPPVGATSLAAGIATTLCSRADAIEQPRKPRPLTTSQRISSSRLVIHVIFDDVGPRLDCQRGTSAEIARATSITLTRSDGARVVSTAPASGQRRTRPPSATALRLLA